MKSAKQGNASAQYKLAHCYSTGKGTEQNNIEASKWLELSAKLGNKNAINVMMENNNKHIPIKQ